MRIVCPECQFAQEIPTDKIPPRAQLATCPRCKFKFRFRELDELPEEQAASAGTTPETARQAPSAPVTDERRQPETEASEPAEPEASVPGDKHYDDHYGEHDAEEEDAPRQTQEEETLRPPRLEEDDLPPFPGERGTPASSKQDKDLWQALDDMAPTDRKAGDAPGRDSAGAEEHRPSAFDGAHDADGDDKPHAPTGARPGEDAPSQRERMDAAQAYLKARQEQDTPERVVVDVPFERPEKYGFIMGLLKTYQRALFSPRLFFRVMPMNGYVKPITFYIILSVALIGLQMLWQKLGMVPVTDPLTQESMAPSALTLQIFLQNLLLFPVLSCSLMLGVSSLLHIFLSMLKGAAEGFEGTVRAMAYSSAPTILLALPSFNQAGYAIINSVALVWGLALTLVACKHIHRTSYPKVILALLLAMLALAMLMTFFILKGQGPATV